MEVYLIRHTAPAVAQGLIYGHTDVPLAAGCEKDMQAVLDTLPLSFDAVYSSPSTRCSLLATLIAPQPMIDERLREVNFGLWEGRTWDDIPPQELDPWMEDFVHCRPPGGESMVQMNDRVIGFWNSLRSKPYKTTALITHAGVIRLIIAAMNGIPLQSAFDIKPAYGEIFRVLC